MSAFDTEEETSVTWLWVDIPLCVLFFLAVSGIPLWMVIKHPDTGPSSDENGVLRRPGPAAVREPATVP
jgi:hypothetical protein